MSAASQQSPISAAPALRLTAEERAVFDRDGFVIRRKFVTDAELAPLAEACLGDPEIDGALVGIADSQGNMQEVVTWTDLTQPDMLTVIPRMARFVDASEDLLGRPVYHWHSKLSMKRPGSAGRWDWHQDYAYWYFEGCLYPDMLTATIAVDHTDEANGCLKLVAGSHKLGRIEHNKIGMASGVLQFGTPESVGVRRGLLPRQHAACLRPQRVGPPAHAAAHELQRHRQQPLRRRGPGPPQVQAAGQDERRLDDQAGLEDGAHRPALLVAHRRGQRQPQHLWLHPAAPGPAEGGRGLRILSLVFLPSPLAGEGANERGDVSG